MRNSILSINPPTQKKKGDENNLKELLLKKEGKKRPCARDGHSATFYKNTVVFLGGDRHMMSFNDMYSLRVD